MLKVDVNKDDLDRKLSSKNIDRGVYALTNQAHADMDRYVPKRQGHLRQDSFARNNTITYTVPYARAQFRGVVGKGHPVRNYTTPGTGKRWDLRAKANHIDDWRKAFVKGGGL